MTISEVFVWTWLPHHDTPVVAGVVRTSGDRFTFTYGRSYLDRSEAITLGHELPLRRGVIEPLPGLTLAGCLRDGSPDAWGRRIIEHERGIPPNSLNELDYMLSSGSNRFGALDFQSSPNSYTPRADTASLDELHQAASMIEAGETLPAKMEAALVDGTTIGGARPKVLIQQGSEQWIAKLSTSSDRTIPAVNAEAACLYLARAAGVNVPASNITTSLQRDVLLVKRFDRGPHQRRHVVSALTMVGLDELAGRYTSYPAILDVLRQYADNPDSVGRELFTRIVFNIAISNHDDHARNHAAFWNGQHLTLTPAYDLTPGARTGDTAKQAIALDRNGNRTSNFATALAAAPIYDLTTSEARSIIDQIRHSIDTNWKAAVEHARLTNTAAAILRSNQILHRATLYGFAQTAPPASPPSPIATSPTRPAGNSSPGCGRRTTKGTPCRRKGHCPYHGRNS